MKPCMPDWLLGHPEYPGSPCMIEEGHIASEPEYIAEVRGQWMPTLCLTCGRSPESDDGLSWWERPLLVWGWHVAIEGAR